MDVNSWFEPAPVWYSMIMIANTGLKRFLLTGVAAAAMAAAPLAGVLVTNSSTLADPAPCVSGDGVACANVPGANASGGNGAASANVPGAGASANGSGTNVFVPGASAQTAPGSAGFCINGWCANAG